MIYFTKLRYRNILSTGNVFTEIDLNGAATTLIVGANGGGKSTMIDALCFALYGKPYRSIKKNQLINSLNRSDLLVEVEFITNGKSYLVRRGAKPDIFEVYMEGSLLNKDAADRDYQDHFEKTILKINFKSFSQVVVLGATTFVPFMQMSASHRRQVIEDLLDLQVFSSMNVLLKDRVSANKQALRDTQFAEQSAQEGLDRSRKFAATLEEQTREADTIREREEARIKLAIQSIERTLAELEESIEQRLAQVPANDGSAQAQKYAGLRVLLTNEVKRLHKELQFFHDNDTCPTCKQGIDHDFKESAIDARHNKSQEVADGIKQLDEKLETLNEKIQAVRALQDEVDELQSQRQMKMHELSVLNRQLKDLHKQPTTSLVDKQQKLNEEIAVLETQLVVAREKHSQLHQESVTLTAAASLLKDGGIKSLIIRKYVPIINQLINKYLAALDFFVAFELDENFNETILSRGRDDFSYASFSEGEKARLDLAIMFTWRALARMRNSMSTNILIFDEVFDGSLDTSGVDDLVKIINEVAHTENIFVISHRPDAWYDKFERVLRFEKKSNFSQLVPA